MDARRRTGCIALICGLVLGACATVPVGPRLMALPGAGKSFEQFQTDDVVCRHCGGEHLDYPVTMYPSPDPYVPAAALPSQYSDFCANANAPLSPMGLPKRTKIIREELRN